MSAVDITARGLAIRALQGSIDLSAPGSASTIGTENGDSLQDIAHTAPASLAADASALSPSANVAIMHSQGQNIEGVGMGRFVYDAAVNAAFVSAHPEASYLTTLGRGYRLDTEQQLNICMFGADPAGVADSTNAFAAAQAFLAAAAPNGGGRLHLPPGTYDILSASGSIPWSLSKVGMVGSGMGATIIRGGFGSQPFKFSGSDVSNVYIADLTLLGPVTNEASGTVENIIFNRVRFENDIGDDTNALKLVADNMSGGFKNIVFIDCEFGPCGRMGVELQNHGNVQVKFQNIVFIRPRVIGTGAQGNNGMGFSLSGYGDGVLIDRPYFDGCDGPLIENVGFNNVTVRDVAARAATLASGHRPISYTNFREMHGCVVNGFRLLPDLQDAPWSAAGDRPTMPAPLYFENCHGLILKNIVAKVGNDEVIEFGSSGQPSSNVSVIDCDLENYSSASTISFVNTAGTHKIINNTVHNAHLTAGRCIAMFGSGKAVLEGGRYTNGGGNLTITTGSGEITVGDDIDGLPKRYREVVTIADGATSSSLVTHGLPAVAGQIVRCHVLGASFGASAPYGSKHGGNTLARANVATAPSGGGLSIEVEVEYAY